MVNNTQVPDHHLSEADRMLYRKQARKILKSGYNLFAEITLRLLESYDALVTHHDNLLRVQADRVLELEFLARENHELRETLADSEVERRRLTEQIKHQQQEIAALKKQKLQIPPSWEQ
jgi:predicted nuclease with TOPRIM domain